MSAQLVQHLKNVCNQDESVKILFSQWEFDQKLVGKALESISGYYPHFSNHNASHSQQILVNIERILGSDIALLTATDTWLILEAAYWHDIGMLVDAKKAKEVHDDPDFLLMVKNIAKDKGHDLHLFCQAYEQDGWTAAIGSENHPFDGVEKYRQLIAEWFRRNHDKRIGNLVTDPFTELGISSPRTELLPNRLYRYLGQICMSHGMNFSNVIEKLPFKQTGLGVEDCHPRFVGCLLRLGDLFDLDDNRFCPVMAKHVSQMPSVSQHHKDKHLSLREFQLDKRTVKLVAECTDEMSFVEAQNWFDWIREEFQNQMSQWNLIVPIAQFGSLPTIEKLVVTMAGNKKLLDNNPMRFSLDESNAIKILQGANLYKDISSILRELIQNSIDATLIRVGLEFEEELKFLNPESEEAKSIFNKFPIEINFLKKHNDWYISIKDQGIGFSLDDLNFIQRIAGSSKNVERVKKISRLPQWMKPSSYFGIGLQSVFLLTDKIKFLTKSFVTNESHQIEMHSPLEKGSGYCFISKIDEEYKKTGATLEFPLNMENLSKSFFVEENYLKQVGFIAVNKDLKAELVQLDIIKNIKEKFNYSSIVIIKFDNILEGKLKDILIKDEAHNKGEINKSYSYWNSRLNLKFIINRKEQFANGTSTFYFKGQKAENRGWSFDSPLSSFYDVQIDFYGLDANECLSVNRDFWLKSFVDKFNIEILVNIFDDIINKANGFECVFSEFYSLVKLYKLNDLSCINNIEFNTNQGYLKLNELKNKNNFYLTKNYYEGYDLLPKIFSPEVILLISELKIIDSLINSMDGFFCNKVEGLQRLAVRGDISLFFSKTEIPTQTTLFNLYKIDSLERSLRYFLESKIIFQAEQRRANDRFQDFQFPIEVCDTLFPESFKNFSVESKVILPLYYTVNEIHFITFNDYISLLSESIKNSITIELYDIFVEFLKAEILKISAIKISG